LNQWVCLPKVLNYREKWIAKGLLVIIVISILAFSFNIYTHKTEVLPKVGGTYQEGILGQPRYINPVLSLTNDSDRDISCLVYSSLFKYNDKSELIPDIVEDYQIKEDGLIYEISLKENVFWHDGEQLTADDIIFTIKTIQDPEYQSPLKNNWQGVKAEKIDQYHIVFRLNNIYAPFLHNLTIGILPKHRWAGISPQDFPLAVYNLEPIGSGPYQFVESGKDENGKIEWIELKRNENFYLGQGEAPFIKKIILRFYSSQDDLINAYAQRDIDGLNFISATNQLELEKINNFSLYEISMPEYYALFFNQEKNELLSDKNIRLALAYAIDKDKIIEEIINYKGNLIDSPFLPGWPAYTENITKYNFDLEKSKEILEEDGWQDQNNNGILEKEIDGETKELEIEILTTNWATLKETANLIKEQWEKIGARVNLKIEEIAHIQTEFIQPREYQVLLFGEVLSAEPDPFAFWHSSQSAEHGLNLSLYKNNEADKLLEEARQITNLEERFKKYTEFQKILTEDIPAIFLYSPTYLYPVYKKVQGISLEKISHPCYRFSQIENWYIKTSRVFK